MQKKIWYKMKKNIWVKDRCLLPKTQISTYVCHKTVSFKKTLRIYIYIYIFVVFDCMETDRKGDLEAIGQSSDENIQHSVFIIIIILSHIILTFAFFW